MINLILIYFQVKYLFSLNIQSIFEDGCLWIFEVTFMSIGDVTIDVRHWTNAKYSLLEGVPGNHLWMKAEWLLWKARASH